MKVLHVISSLDPRSGGPAQALVGLTEAQTRTGLDVTIVSTFTEHSNTDAADRLRKHGVTVHLIGPATGKLNRHPDLHSQLRVLIAAADIVHIHAIWEEIQHDAAKLARHRGVPYIIRPCGMLDPWSLSQNALVKRLYLALRLKRDLNHAAAMHFTSDIERDLTKPLKIKSQSIVEPNGLDLAEFATMPAKGSFRRKHEMIGFRPMVLFLSRLHPKKGLELLLPAFAKAATNDEVLVIAGPDSENYRAKIEALADSLGIRDRVIFTGMLKGMDRVAAYGDADLFVLPSHQENFGIAVAEALAAGTAVIVSDQVNIHPTITASQLGGVVPMDVDALAAEMKKWLANPELRRAAGERARALVTELYDWQKIAARWTSHYRALLGATPP